MKKNYEELAKLNGKVNYEGKEYAITDEAFVDNIIGYDAYNQQTNRLNDINDGEEYTLVIAAYAIDKEQNKYRVTWHFEQIKGEEYEDLGLLDWDDDSKVCEVEAV